jgi:hypothetical protein
VDGRYQLERILSARCRSCSSLATPAVSIVDIIETKSARLSAPMIFVSSYSYPMLQLNFDVLHRNTHLLRHRRPNVDALGRGLDAHY